MAVAVLPSSSGGGLKVPRAVVVVGPGELVVVGSSIAVVAAAGVGLQAGQHRRPHVCE